MLPSPTKLSLKSMRGIPSDRAPMNSVLYLLCTLLTSPPPHLNNNANERWESTIYVWCIRASWTCIVVYNLRAGHGRLTSLPSLLGKWCNSWQTIPKISIFKFDIYFLLYFDHVHVKIGLRCRKKVKRMNVVLGCNLLCMWVMSLQERYFGLQQGHIRYPIHYSIAGWHFQIKMHLELSNYDQCWSLALWGPSHTHK